MQWYQVKRRLVNIDHGDVVLPDDMLKLFKDSLKHVADDVYSVKKPIQIPNGVVFGCSEKLHPHNVKSVKRPIDESKKDESKSGSGKPLVVGNNANK